MKFTKISSDKAYKLHTENKCNKLYFLGVDTLTHLKVPRHARFARQYFREREMFVGEDLPKVTIRQQIECHCVDKFHNTNEDVLKMITLAKTGKEFTGWPVSDELSCQLFNARAVTKKYILFDIDSNGKKSNFRFE